PAASVRPTDFRRSYCGNRSCVGPRVFRWLAVCQHVLVWRVQKQRPALLGYNRNSSSHLPGARHSVAPEHEYGARARKQLGRRDSHEGCLSRAVCAEETVDLTSLHTQRKTVECSRTCIVDLLDSGRLKRS